MRLMPGRLALRIYLASVAQLVATVIAVFVVGRLTFRDRPPPFLDDAEYVLSVIESHRSDPEALAQELERVRAHLDGAVSLYADDVALIGSSSVPPIPPLTEAERAGLTKDTMIHRLGSGPVIARPLGSGWGLFQLKRSSQRPSPDPVVVAVTFTLFASAIASVLLARSLARPITTLADAARGLGAGDLTVRAGIRRKDELGQLAVAFDDMAERLSQLVRAQQELLANVSHELRTPLARIRVALDLANEGDAATARESLGEIDEDLEELQRLVADVLRMARLDLASGRAGAAIPPLTTAPIEALDIVDKSVLRFRAAHPDRLLEVDIPPGLPPIDGDVVLLHRVLDNLLENAAGYSEPATAIVVTGRRVGEALVLKVIDRGVGISSADLPRVTTPFFRADRSRTRVTGGLGLGLSLARRIVEAHGGTLALESALGSGTTVTVTLPLGSRG